MDFWVENFYNLIGISLEISLTKMQFLVHITIEEFNIIVRDTLKEVITETSLNANIKVEESQDEFMNVL